MTTTPDAAAIPVLYAVKRFPRLSETFVLQEMLHLLAQGVAVARDHALERTSPAADILAAASPRLGFPLA